MSVRIMRQRFGPAVDEIIESCEVSDGFVDKDLFRVYIATIWGNAVVDPDKTGIEETDLEDLHDFLNEEIGKILGKGETITGCFEYLVSQAGEDSMTRLQVAAHHREFINYFARLILAGDYQA